jgi:hypothetical protein
LEVIGKALHDRLQAREFAPDLVLLEPAHDLTVERTTVAPGGPLKLLVKVFRKAQIERHFRVQVAALAGHSYLPNGNNGSAATSRAHSKICASRRLAAARRMPARRAFRCLRLRHGFLRLRLRLLAMAHVLDLFEDVK